MNHAEQIVLAVNTIRALESRYAEALVQGDELLAAQLEGLLDRESQHLMDPDFEPVQVWQ